MVGRPGSISGGGSAGGPGARRAAGTGSGDGSTTAEKVGAGGATPQVDGTRLGPEPVPPRHPSDDGVDPAAVEVWERHLATLPVRRSRQDALRARRRRGYERAALGWGLGTVPRQSVGPVSFESEAVRIVEIALVLAPVLLQTSAYARELFIADGVRQQQELDRRIALRIERQAVLTRETAPVQFEAFIDEPVLLRPVGGLRIMAEQLRHVVAMARRPNVRVRVVPSAAGGPVRLDGGLLILDFPLRSTVVHLEHGRLHGLLDRAEDTAVFSAILPVLAATALAPAESLALLTRLAEELEDRSS
ncbi:hypothetical protein UA75_06035 [Actinoalloteichus sp. GBA129-24]|uniref:DUF5753 domain-containing protein n=2 Tax=Pseudonocardiaceae TaxID=2070 RepID=A0AAC9PQN4_9PSEU|nr:hypothetical protein UA74_06030 [Actinoalloteichus fjordicus]APU19231.1 hypothetical protein UA75_06035 [Actinoalloteichus sp. GBA129-24]